MAQAGAEDVGLAVDAARDAFGTLVEAAGQRAREIYFPHRPLARRNAPASSRCSRALNGGKPIKESRDFDVPMAAAHFFYYAGWADKLEYAFPAGRPRPLGVVGQIIPWNFPLLMLAWKLAPALAAGNTVVLKPAETTPLTALLFCEMLARPSCRRASSTSSRATARPAPRWSTPSVDKIAFTGSTEVGKAIQRRSPAPAKS